MMDGLELPVGARFRVHQGSRSFPAVVVAGSCCACCDINRSERLCATLECRSFARNDGVSVVFQKEEEGGEQ